LLILIPQAASRSVVDSDKRPPFCMANRSLLLMAHRNEKVVTKKKHPEIDRDARQ